MRGAAKLQIAEAVADVAGAVEGFEIEAGRAADGSLETLGVADGPRGHEAAVAVAKDAGASGVGEGALQHGVDYGHEVEVVFAAPVVDDLLSEGAAVGERAAWIREDDQEIVAGEALLDKVESVAVV